jgi:diguanylate cyclase (GGDEF)-like protein
VIRGIDEIGLRGQALDDYLSLHPEQVVRLISKLKISDVNQASMSQYKAKSKQQMIDQTAQIFHNVNINLVRRELVQMANRTRIFELELENCTFANEVLTVRMRWSVFPGYEENMGRVIVSTTDITREVKEELLRSTVMQITQETSNAETLNDLYKSIHSTLAKIMPADNLYIALYDDENGMISFPYFVDQYDDPPGPHPFGNGWTEYVIRTGKASLLSRDQVIKLQEEEGINNNGADSIDWLGVPLNVKDRTIGVLAVQTYEAGTRYTQEHCDWLTFVSTQIAMAIDRKKAEEALKFSSTHDKLTGLYNRAYFEEEVSRLSAGRQNPVGVIIMDVDGLKRTNDTYGHSAGDELLRATAHVLQQAFRSNDVVARIGGDEFVVLLPYSTGLVVEKAIQRIEKYLVRYNHNGHAEVSLSIGSACTEDGNSLSDTIKLADQRMYEEKNRRRAKSILPNS